MNLIRFAFYKMKLNELIKSGQNKAFSAYLINKEIINKLKQIYKAKEIITLLSDSHQLDGFTYENVNKNFPKISKFLNDNKPEYINSFKDLEINGGISFTNTEGNISLKRLNNNQKIIYIEDFEIIDNEFATFLSSKFKDNLNILPIIILPRENKIFAIITYNQNYIYEIVISNNKNIYKAEYVLEILNNNTITSDKKNLNNYILDVFNTYGIQKLIAQKSPFHTGNNIYFDLHPVNGVPEINNAITPQSSVYQPPIVQKNYIPSERLKVLALLAVSQLYSFNNNKIHKAFLINPEWLEFYQYNKIQKIVNDIYQKFPDSSQFWNMTYELNSLSKIFSQINEDKIKELDKKINIKNKNQFHSNHELINIQGKLIPLYKNFILINEELYVHFHKYFSIKINYNIRYYHKEKEGDYIILENYGSFLNIILFGIIDKKENKFHIKGIFNYMSKELLINEISDLINYGISYYLSDKTVLNNHDKNDLISPIFSNDEIIGSYYKYENYDYNKCFNYMEYYNNQQLKNIIYLYINEKSIKNKIKGTSFNNEEYYLIKKQVLKHLEKNNNYENMKNILKGKINNFPKDKKDLYSIIKSIPINHLKQLSSNNNNINFNNSNFTSVEINQSKSFPEPDTIDPEVNCISIPNPYNKNEVFLVFDGFELVDKYIAALFKKNLNFHKLKCSFVGDNRIVFHYPINTTGNNKYMCLISTFDEDNNFINEYLLRIIIHIKTILTK